ncbi:glycosyltransferase family 1 protein [Pseudoalteromonas sp. MMG010]|uniref:glycosyltransferase family 1 protein n=1 Tax=Pseudoalteromonas sp. MMG010 TaxID=2822685 RepID=UPI001B3A615B|nr:glycosyltransferase family 1 protein [Pseudoalteromonas sp. MMG010]MBQ4834021.1 glycosyltransferase family 1 protein [Pseudoalteromonas sp. MMG010]
MEKKRLLFIPVSSPKGVGEYMRSLVLAQSLSKQFTDSIEIQFILNKKTTYAHRCPFKTTLLEKSATKDNPSVYQVIRDFKPDIVVFDCAGRAGQMKVAKEVAAKVIFISQHSKKRAKGLKLNRINLIDEHWVVQPEYCIKPLSWLERLKLKLFPLTRPQNVGTFMSLPSSEHNQSVLSQYSLEEKKYILVNAGSGGHSQNGELCADTYLAIAENISKITKLKVVVVYGPNYPKQAYFSTQVTCLSSVDNNSFISLLSQAKCAVLSGGDTVLQAIALKVPTVACAIANDQGARLSQCERVGAVRVGEFSVNAMTMQVTSLIEEPAYQTMLNNLTTLNSEHSFNTIYQGVERLLKTN